MKKLEKYGVAAENFTDSKSAKGYTYTKNNDEFPPTPLIFDENPFSDVILNGGIKNVLDIGCGVGRNASGVFINTDADYYGIDPNPSMLQYFWDYNNRLYEKKTHLFHDFEQMELEINPLIPSFDLVLVTFVYQHIGYRPSSEQMNITDITKAAQKYTHKDTIWIMYEHDGEEKWIDRWMQECNVTPTVYLRDYPLKDMHDRGNHHLIIWQG